MGGFGSGRWGISRRPLAESMRRIDLAELRRNEPSLTARHVLKWNVYVATANVSKWPPSTSRRLGCTSALGAFGSGVLAARVAAVSSTELGELLAGGATGCATPRKKRRDPGGRTWGCSKLLSAWTRRPPSTSYRRSRRACTGARMSVCQVGMMPTTPCGPWQSCGTSGSGGAEA